MDFQIAWRNIWRYPRRTSVILIAVVIGVWSMIFLGALMRGIIVGMIHNGINTLTGHILIHQSRYPDDPSIDNSIANGNEVLREIETLLPANSHFASRVRVNTIVSNARHNGGATLVGIDPAEEKPLSFIGSAVTRGSYLNAEDNGAILVGRALAKRFDTELGHKLILMTQDKTGQITSKAYRIAGIFQAEMESTEKAYVFVARESARKMLKMGPAISEISILLPSPNQADQTATALEAEFAGQALRVRTWQDALPLLQAYLDLYDSFIMIWFLVVFVAMGFGILNTTLMAVFERMREFGLLKALGMRPIRIVKGILTEALIILLVGLFIGNALGLASAWALSFHGIDLSALAQGVEYAGMSRVIFPMVLPKDMLGANLVVLLLGLLVCLYPAIKAARFTPVEAMIHH
jgi:ABC-type lipoprotein release transport system permease subunit